MPSAYYLQQENDEFSTTALTKTINIKHLHILFFVNYFSAGTQIRLVVSSRP